MLIQIHILQNYAPSNLNRDDTGSPKDAIFGGFRRGRISSQCIKRSMRKSSPFVEAFDTEELIGIRTKQLPDLIAKELEILGVEEAVRSAILKRVPEIGKESGKGKEAADEEEAEGKEEQAGAATRQLIFLGRNELPALAKNLLQVYQQLGEKAWEKAKIADITRALGSSLPRSIDIAMFGRMTTSSAFKDVEAAVQVAHALSPHALTQEFDYYTAVDDLSGESGAGMIGDVEFNSSTYYKYLNVHWEQLLENLGGDKELARRAILALVESAVYAQPSGKQHSFAAFNLPDLVLVEVCKKNLPVSYANAFIRPVRASGDKSLVDASVEKLGEYMGKIGRTYNLPMERAFTALQEYQLPGAQPQESLADLNTWLAERLPQ